MSSVHLPRRLAQISRSFAATDGRAWVVIAIGAATAALIYAAFFLH
jgi:hypothetical protein